MTTESTVFSQCEVLASGIIQVLLVTTVVLDDGRILEPTNYRYVLEPGDTVDDTYPIVSQIAGAIWTPDLLAAWEAQKVASESEETVSASQD